MNKTTDSTMHFLRECAAGRDSAQLDENYARRILDTIDTIKNQTLNEVVRTVMEVPTGMRHPLRPMTAEIPHYASDYRQELLAALDALRP